MMTRPYPYLSKTMIREISLVFPVRVDLEYLKHIASPASVDGFLDWCREAFGNEYFYHCGKNKNDDHLYQRCVDAKWDYFNHSVYFLNEDDAMICKLRWC